MAEKRDDMCGADMGCPHEEEIIEYRLDIRNIKGDLRELKNVIREGFEKINVRLAQGDNEFTALRVKQAKQNGIKEAEEKQKETEIKRIDISMTKIAVIVACMDVVFLVLFKIMDLIIR
jgi:hypothetical protein